VSPQFRARCARRRESGPFSKLSAAESLPGRAKLNKKFFAEAGFAVKGVARRGAESAALHRLIGKSHFHPLKPETE